jgi:hypothetical protein
MFVQSRSAGFACFASEACTPKNRKILARLLTLLSPPASSVGEQPYSLQNIFLNNWIFIGLSSADMFSAEF